VADASIAALVGKECPPKAKGQGVWQLLLASFRDGEKRGCWEDYWSFLHADGVSWVLADAWCSQASICARTGYDFQWEDEAGGAERRNFREDLWTGRERQREAEAMVLTQSCPVARIDS
jgi:hypothetical protein